MKHTLSTEEIQLPSSNRFDVPILPSYRHSAQQYPGQCRQYLAPRIRKSNYTQFSIDAESPNGAPENFDQPTLRWALKIARSVLIRSGDRGAHFPISESNVALVRATLGPRVREKGGLVAVINTVPHLAVRWSSYVRRHCRPGTNITRVTCSTLIKEVTR